MLQPDPSPVVTVRVPQLNSISARPVVPIWPRCAVNAVVGVEPLHDDLRQHPENPAQKIRHPRDVRILPPSRDFH